PALEEMEAYLENEPDKPMILCEYCHAMGNGPGDLEDYFQMSTRWTTANMTSAPFPSSSAVWRRRPAARSSFRWKRG
ncbi:MAG: hypothetical protein IIV05_00655, partial [Ruminococcus sp.]|nr:hypothetical protein [Ruminococcus sp.]